MGRAPCCAKVGLHRGPWTAKEDALLTKYIQAHGEGSWRSLPKKAEPEKLKVHNPKAIRITSLSFLSRNNSFDLAPRNEGVIQVPWSNFKKDAERYDSGVGFLINDDDQNRDRDPDILNGLDPLKCQTDLPMSDTNLEKLYEEYLQLLKTEDNDQVQLDSFAESLLI
ncbi:unnamed protein product [Thlaspi arvense]|uniref:Myb-like domain-containing protein n=1 Tax=Thlaspi arvense TaxID=13288 RepID=A0AAU9S7K5_THLAR|nr:unnamed protein product [Thlaspi arvense]